MQISKLLRENIRLLVPYSSARTEFSGKSEVFLDANENSLDLTGLDVNRYPDPRSSLLKQKIAEKDGVLSDQIVAGNGSDEIMDNLIRMFCEPGKDSIIIFPPTYGAYSVFAQINNVKVISIPLKKDFSLPNPEGLKGKLMFICTPNNPTGNDYDLSVIEKYASTFNGIVIVDEAYKDFSSLPSAVSLINKYSNVVVLKTFSKAWALAGARVGYMVADKEICDVMNKMKYPYNLSSPAQKAALISLGKKESVIKVRDKIISERKKLAVQLSELKSVIKVYPSEANFLLVKVTNADRIYKKLQKAGIVIRNRSNQLNLSGCLRVTVGTEEENKKLLNEWEKIDNEE